MRSVLLALALLPGAAAMGKYVPESCTETPGGHLIKIFDLDDVCSGGVANEAFREPCDDDTTYLLKCYDYCIDVAVPPSDRPGAAYKWADIGYNSPSDGQGSVCGHSEVPCYCATACPETFGGSQGLIAGPCDADEPAPPLDVGDGDADSRAP